MLMVDIKPQEAMPFATSGMEVHAHKQVLACSSH